VLQVSSELFVPLFASEVALLLSPPPLLELELPKVALFSRALAWH